MAAELPSPRLAGKVQVRVSPLVDLGFAAFVARKPGKEQSSEWLRDLIEVDPELRIRFTDFWPDSAEYCYDELLVIAHAAGQLFAPDPEKFLTSLCGGVAEITVPPLPSEDDGAQARIQGRIDLLRTNTNIRHDYVDMMRSLWRQLEPIWRATARDEAEALALELRRRIETATNIGEILPGSHIAMLDRHRSYVAWSVERAEAVIVPLTLNPSGTYLFSFPGQLVISYGPEAARRATVRREQSARAATRFKVLGDPTRVAFVNRLIHGPMSVTDLALYFELAQPTVSAHIKILREAGLLESERSGTYTLYRVSEERLRAFVEEGFADAVRQN